MQNVGKSPFCRQVWLIEYLDEIRLLKPGLSKALILKQNLNSDICTTERKTFFELAFAHSTILCFSYLVENSVNNLPFMWKLYLMQMCST